MMQLLLVGWILQILPFHAYYDNFVVAAAPSAGASPTNSKKVATRVMGFASSKQTTSLLPPASTTTSSTSTTTTTTTTETKKSSPQKPPSSLFCVQYSSSEGVLYFQSSQQTGDMQKNNFVIQISAHKQRIWECSAISPSNNCNISASDWVPLDGLFGVYIIPSGTIWVLITGSELVYDAPPILVGDHHHHATSSHNNKTTSSQLQSWLQIRRVTDLELVHIPCRLLSIPQLKEEVRQVQLLRKALKQHSFYYVAPSSDTSTSASDKKNIVPDMTKNLQRAFRAFLHSNETENNNIQEENATTREDNILQTQHDHLVDSQSDTVDDNHTTATTTTNAEPSEDVIQNLTGESGANRDDDSFGNNNKGIRSAAARGFWWEDPGDKNNGNRPDSRFFWNEAAVQPLIQRYHEFKNENKISKRKGGGNGSSKNTATPPAAAEAQANRLLLEKMIPLTSAFVGVQCQIRVAEEEGKECDKDHQEQSCIVYDELLISRRSRFRAGTRFTKRGADATGAVANYAETEQICFLLQNCTINHDHLHKKKSSKKRKQQQQQEQILHQVCSHVQTRGSIPLRWSSPTDIKTYRPRVRIGMDPIAQTRALLAHVLEQLSLYAMDILREDTFCSECSRQNLTTAKLIFVNLIDKKSDQGRLGRAFDAVLSAVMEVYAPPNITTPLSPSALIATDSALSYDTPNASAILSDSSSKVNENTTNQVITLEPNSIEHVWYDFHAEVKNGRWDRLAKLLKQVQPALLDHGYFCVQASGEHAKTWKITNLQRAVVRTNCMDCLDRTNVVQSLFGRWMLFHQLEQYKPRQAAQEAEKANAHITAFGASLPAAFVSTFNKNPLALPWEKGEVSHRLLWADNADTISRLYAGTAALKGDFTRTGKRTKRGALDDGMNSLQRYYLNNFLDADRQEGTDLLVGYAPFSNLDETAGSTGSKEGNSSGWKSNTDLSQMTLQEAARQLLLGNNVFKSQDDDEDDNEQNFARIKQYKQHHPFLRKSLDTVVGGASHQTQRRRHRYGRKHSQDKKATRPLDLRWLPGDLQDQLRSRAMNDGVDGVRGQKLLGVDAEYSSAAALAAIDRRSASDEPWWVVPDSSDDEELGDELIDHEKARSDPGAKTIHAGYFLSSLLIGIRAPVFTAVVVVALLEVMYMPKPPKPGDEDSKP